ncbi:sulfatase [Urechidicola vernalis]|uniref:Sulfatase n=1 Tax=Urechidicola vernalis TaxID=3075600 RepID=A0ABU2Y0Z3_9FLAO|nr:sulfatase [Urechidicola sp. P050]MDT0551843.1 sulfatase [Urechidicola sp. P050]
MCKNIKYIVCVLFLGTLSISAQEKQPNILFIAIDDMNDWTGFLGGHSEAITPNLDKIADKGINFANAHVSAPGCSPSRNSLLYGVEPFNSGLYPFYEHDIHKQLRKKYTTLPTLLKANGYNTFGSGKIHHGSSDDPNEWTDYYEPKNANKKFKDSEGYKRNAKHSFRPTLHPDEEHRDHQFANYGIEKLQEKHDKPFFLAVGIVKPHLPFDAPIRFFDKYPKEVDLENFKEDDLSDIPQAGKKLVKQGEFNQYKKDEAWGKIRRAYLASISWADYNIGRVLDALEASDYADNTVIVIWSDHGYHLGEKNTFKKFTLWEEATRVPFIIYDGRIKNQPQGRNYVEPVSLINVYKTIAEYTGVEVPEYVDGESLIPIIKDQTEQLTIPTITSWGRGNYAVRTKTHRYIRYYNGGEELYDHTADPNEWNNLAKDENQAELIKELKSHLPKNEHPMISDFVSPWSVEGADKAKYRGKNKK